MSITRTLGFTFSTLATLVSVQALWMQLRKQAQPSKPSLELRTLRRIERLLHDRLGPPRYRTKRASAVEYGDLV